MTAANGPIRRAGGRQRRQQILEATLRLIARDGVRAVRHRAIASEAGVPLAATTYYFADLGDLLQQAFIFFHQRRASAVARLQRDALALLAGEPPAGSLPTRELAAAIAELLTRYILAQAAAKDELVIELAFKHEAQRDAALAALIREKDERFCDDIAVFLRQLGSDDPHADAQITLSVILRLESESAFSGMTDTRVERVIARQVEGLLAFRKPVAH